MGAFSIKGPAPKQTKPSQLPCAECATKPCCRVNNNVDVHHDWQNSTFDAAGNVAAPVRGNCANLIAGGCSIHNTSRYPHVCTMFDCSPDLLFRHQHPEVDALLKYKGL